MKEADDLQKSLWLQISMSSICRTWKCYRCKCTCHANALMMCSFDLIVRGSDNVLKWLSVFGFRCIAAQHSSRTCMKWKRTSAWAHTPYASAASTESQLWSLQWRLDMLDYKTRSCNRLRICLSSPAEGSKIPANAVRSLSETVS